MGGYYRERLDSTEKWTIGTTSFETASPLKEPLDDTAAVASNSNEYVGYLVGGWTKQITNKVWALRKEDETWIEVESKSLQQRRYLHTLVNLGLSDIPGC